MKGRDGGMSTIIEVKLARETKTKKVVESTSGDALSGCYLSEDLYKKLQEGETIEISLAGTSSSNS